MNGMLLQALQLRMRPGEKAGAPRIARAEAAMKPHVNRAVVGIGLAYPMATAPQFYNVWVLGRTGGLSEITSIAGLVMAITWLIYGILHRNPTIVGLNSLWVVLHAAMAIGIAVHAA